MANEGFRGEDIGLISVQLDPPVMAGFLMGVQALQIGARFGRIPDLITADWEAIHWALNRIRNRDWNNPAWLKDA